MKNILSLLCFLGFYTLEAQEVVIRKELFTDYMGSEFNGVMVSNPPLVAQSYEWNGYPNGVQALVLDQTFTVEEGCYTFSADDGFGDGFGFTHGYFRLTWLRPESTDSVLVFIENNWGDVALATFCVVYAEEIIVDNFPGCTNPSACNYEIDANEDDGSCEFTSCLVYGCTDITAVNYNFEATTDDGSCLYVIAGCMDDGALNYNFEATVDDGSCIYPIVGCTNPTACNYDPTATLNNGCDFVSCHVYGCLDPDAFNFNPEATDPDFSQPLNGCAYWAPSEIVVTRTCNDFSFTVISADGSEMPANADINNWSIGDDIYVENGGTNLSYSIEQEGTYVVVFIYSQGAFITSVETIVSTGSCPGDFNCDRTISVIDLLMLISEFSCVEDCTTDMDTDGIVGVSDLISFISVYGTNCPN